VIHVALDIVVHTLLGGLLAIAYTDLLQVGVMVLGIGILLPLYVPRVPLLYYCL
jgi:Na+/proline symporter